MGKAALLNLAGWFCVLLATIGAVAARAQSSGGATAGVVGYANLDLAGVDGEQSWLAGGFGKTRFGASAPGSGGSFRLRPQATEAGIVLEPRLGWALGATVSGIAQAGQRHDFDLSEAFASFHPLPFGGVKAQVRAGLFWPPVSLEHTAGEWAVRDTVTPSAINSWIGEEVKVLGLEASVSGLIGSHRVSATVAIFSHNDTAGTLLSFRGWALGDAKATAFGSFPLPPLNTFMQTVQASYTRPVIRLGNRAGYYAKLSWRPPLPIEFQFFRYDNRVNPELVDANLQWGWRTRFDHIGLIVDPDDRTRLTLQAMQGTTRMGFPVAGVRWVDTRFRSAFLLATREVSDITFSARGELFDTRSRGSRLGREDGEHGWAATIAARHSVTRFATVFLEALHVDSERGARARGGLDPEQTQTIVRLTLRGRIAG